jgi:hypothetical protein
MKPTLRRIVQQIHEHSVKATANSESDGAELEIWWTMVKGGLIEPMTWQRLKTITEQMASGEIEATEG